MGSLIKGRSEISRHIAIAIFVNFCCNFLFLTMLFLLQKY
ncbi:hypothetical protein GXM_09015 [Nostoc sphaeroides CCNUC1]|uniref:Uncharacterized protein n=1 Tax=Nostoc sphaeroides CCNUC1 TaxID=2653204 RepID=A0A5P8WG25_9NOSO|nr:hypothetical protein GXM_09015 [Nostoc sphaeroides CCNUC1]